MEVLLEATHYRVARTTPVRTRLVMSAIAAAQAVAAVWVVLEALAVAAVWAVRAVLAVWAAPEAAAA